MSKLSLYSIFHANLQFSSIPQEHHKEIIERCYRTILELNRKYPLRCGLEFSGYTLERINELDSSFIKEVKCLMDEKKIEIVGSSYSQTIFPLIPAKVNLKNIEIGKKIYKKFFNIIPEIFYLNEQVFSKSLVDLYLQENISTIIFDWDNTKLSGKIENKYKYNCPFISGTDDKNKIRVLWNNSISFQKLQRYLFEEITLESYLEYLFRQTSPDRDRCFLWYGSDLEIFDYRPGTLDIEYTEPSFKTVKRLENKIERLLEEGIYHYELPGNIVKNYSVDNKLNLNFAEYPVTCKKQSKYNTSRWAVCGRSNTFLNRECYDLYRKMESSPVNDREEYWKTLNYLWGSDFRTFSSDRKIIDFYKQAGNFSVKINNNTEKSLSENNRDLKKSKNLSTEIIETDAVSLLVNFKRGLAIKKAYFKNISEKWLFGTILNDLYEDIRFSSDQYSGHFITQDINNNKITDISFDTGKNVKERLCRDKILIFTKIIPDKRIEFYKNILLYKNSDRIELTYHFKFSDFHPLYFRTGIITFNPDAFDLNTLYYATHNGGFNEEKYFLKGIKINQIQTIDNRITSSHCTGATENYIKIGDKDKEIKISLNKAQNYLVPLLHFEEINNNYYLRIYHSMAETDETSGHQFRGQMKIQLLIETFRK